MFLEALSLAGIIQKFDPLFFGSVCVVATECGVLLREPSLSCLFLLQFDRPGCRCFQKCIKGLKQFQMIFSRSNCFRVFYFLILEMFETLQIVFILILQR